jgi:hypothetical protein
MLSYALPGDPYAALMTQGADLSSAMMTPEAVASAIVDAAELPTLPLRIPIGEWTETVLAARRAARDDVPFLPMPLNW